LVMSGSNQRRVTEFISKGMKRKPAVVIFDEFTSSPSNNTKKRRIPREIVGQMAIDAGQAKIGAQRCAKCEMVYSLDVESDVIDHDNFCRGTEKMKSLFVKRSTLDAWVKKVLSLVPGHSSYPLTGMCTVVLKVDQACSIINLKTKVEEVVKNHVNKCLGFTEEGSMWNSNLSSTYCDSIASSSQCSFPSPSSSRSFNQSQRKAFMAIVRDEKGISSIAGLVLAESICRAIDVDGEKMIRNNRLVGINRLWVNEEMRRKGIGNTMVDAVRESFYSLQLPTSNVVFSEPTKDGERFARSYVKNDGGRLLVYNLGNVEKWKEVMKKMNERRKIINLDTVEKKEEEKTTVDEEENM
ncbi:hypothetical protein PRIPAC_94569, partial [Pristionchus pacificus]|uniref:N-acetyltransferase domain-containing protein n=1 Tax=Pristionchus pacificus TaxID=54126 RepID=A0A8R1Z8V9_PRIPA